MKRKYLIINADDFGLCHSANAAVFDLFESGCLKSSTVMTPCPGAEEAVAFAASHPQYAIGVHLTHTNEWKDHWPWGSLTGGKSLENEAGRMWPESEDFEAHCNYREAMAESLAQIRFCEDRGMNPSHVDSHMGAVYGLNGKLMLLPMTLKMCGELGYPFRMFSKPLDSQCPPEAPLGLFRAACRFAGFYGKLHRVPMPDYLIFPEQIETGNSYEEFKNNFIEYLIRIPYGICETYIHPAYPTEEMQHISGTWRRRGWEHDVMKDPETHAAFKTHGVHLISYRDLVKLREAGI
ncbi:MAG: polysaccharide deacetylase family protein [Clostridia bacterium]|nr:polysaccharide deacetylase family protein [Clostridia bacterium]MBR0536891.1 polysaccharide deacetylase family protein [Clostridia bacterium]